MSQYVQPPNMTCRGSVQYNRGLQDNSDMGKYTVGWQQRQVSELGD